MPRSMRFGVTLPQIKRSWEEARATAECVDRLGFDSVWVCDHLYGVPLPTLPIFDELSTQASTANLNGLLQRLDQRDGLEFAWFGN